MMGANTPHYLDVTVEQVKQTLDARTVTLLDVRTRQEYDSGHIEGAILMPLSELSSRVDELTPKKTVLVYCQRGTRSSQASAMLSAWGFTRVYNMLGGISKWEDMGFPVSSN